MGEEVRPLCCFFAIFLRPNFNHFLSTFPRPINHSESLDFYFTKCKRVWQSWWFKTRIWNSISLMCFWCSTFEYFFWLATAETETGKMNDAASRLEFTRTLLRFIPEQFPHICWGSSDGKTLSYWREYCRPLNLWKRWGPSNPIPVPIIAFEHLSLHLIALEHLSLYVHASLMPLLNAK